MSYTLVITNRSDAKLCGRINVSGLELPSSRLHKFADKILLRFSVRKMRQKPSWGLFLPNKCPIAIGELRYLRTDMTTAVWTACREGLPLLITFRRRKSGRAKRAK